MDDINVKKISIAEFILRAIAVLLIVALLVGFFGSLTKRKDSERKYGDLMQYGDEIDVLFLGSSHMMNAVDPAQLFFQTGITSYNMGKPGGMLPESYWTYKLARQYVTPKCVVVDLWSLDRDYKYVDVMTGENDADEIRNSVSLLHTNLDAWPLSRTKVDAVLDLVSTFSCRAEFLFDFSLYHSRWSKLNRDDFILDNKESENDSYLLGAEARREIYINHSLYEPEDKTGTLEKDSVSTIYLKKIIEECQAEGIDVVLTFMPMSDTHIQDFQAVNYGRDIAEEYSIEFISLLDQSTQSVIDYESDMSDETHVNEFGMYKITSYIGERLREHECLSDNRQKEGYELYSGAVDKWQSERVNNLLTQKNLYMALGYADMLDANIVMYLRGGSDALYDGYIRRQIKKLSGTDAIEMAKEAGGPYVLVKEKDPETLKELLFERGGESSESGIPVIGGVGEYIGLKDFGAFYINGDYDSNLFDMDDRYHTDVQMLILGQDGEVLSSKYFDVDWKAD